MDNSYTLTTISQRKKQFLTLLLICVTLLSFFVLPNLLGSDPADDSGYFAEHLQVQQIRMASAFVVAKTINAAISILQGIDIGFSFGVEFNMSPFEILDPANDIIENISNVFLLALGAITLEKVLLSISSYISFKILLPISSLLMLISISIKNSYSEKIKQTSINIFALSLTLALFLPISIQTSVFLENTILGKTISTSQTALMESGKAAEMIGGEIAQLQQTNNKQSTQDMDKEEDKGFWGKAKDSVSSIGDIYSITELKNKLSNLTAELSKQADIATDNFLNLLVVFIINSFILPILTIFILWKLLAAVLGNSIEEISLKSLAHSEVEQVNLF